MLRSFYIAGTGMLTQRQKMDVIINNVTNTDTTGYKKDQVISRTFDDLLLNRLNEDPNVLNTRTGTRISGNSEVGPQNTGVQVDELVIDWTQGPMEATGRQTDMAITGDGFFAVQTPAGERYTRAGNFQVDSNGTLLTSDGNYVLGRNGGMINVGTGDFYVNQNGEVYVDNQQVGALRIVQFADNGVLRKEGGNLFYALDGAPQQMANPVVEQGLLEGSNLDVGREMAEMLQTNRVYESSQRMLRMVDESLEKTVNQIAQF
ncbi:MAG: flagellar basal-body rod protein FlgF [Clostridia bacterium]|nr:flagellar basal-body rod protein FlgF [Clostridia bacterium]